MSGRDMSLKAKIRKLAREKNMSPQVVLQNFMFERFLERLSKSDYKDKFILKGGMLIAALVGIGNRATMDMDATIKEYPINAESLTKAIKDICNTAVSDDVVFRFSDIEAIRDTDTYGGYRISVISKYDDISTPMKIDITAGDSITPKEVQYPFRMNFKEGSISVWAYNVETVLAEKVETILRRGELNTRPRDFYDVYILTKTQNYSLRVFEEAIKTTVRHRKTAHIFENTNHRLNEIEESEDLRSKWEKYTRDYSYAEGISYEDTINTLKLLVQNFLR